MATVKKVDIHYGGKTYKVSHFDNTQLFQRFFAKGNFYELDLLEAIKHKGYIGAYLDIGANAGNHTLFFAHHCPSTKVYSIEPYKVLFDILEDNVKSNERHEKIILSNIGISDKDGTAGIIPGDPTNLGDTQIGPGDDVQVKSLDRFCEEIKNISVIKIDTEGHEIAILKGGVETLKKHGPLLAIEIDNDDNYKTVMELIEPLGYKMKKRYCATPTYIFERR